MSDSVFHTFANALASGQLPGVDPNAFARGFGMGLENRKVREMAKQNEALFGLRKQELPIKQQQADAQTLNAQTSATRVDPQYLQDDYNRRLAIKGTPSGDPVIAGAAQRDPTVFQRNPQDLVAAKNQGEYGRRFSAESGAQDARLQGHVQAQGMGVEMSPDQKIAGQLLKSQEGFPMQEPGELLQRYDQLLNELRQRNPRAAAEKLKELRATVPGASGMGMGGGQPQPQGGGVDPTAWQRPNQIIDQGVQSAATSKAEQYIQQGMSPEEAVERAVEELFSGR